MSSPNDFFVQLTENRLQQSLGRLNSTDNRALGLLGLVAVLLTGLWAVNFRHGMDVVSNHPGSAIAAAFLVIALLTAGTSLLLTAQYDSPDMAILYEK
jgi:Mg2+ and Co2+ transporter CorA